MDSSLDTAFEIYRPAFVKPEVLPGAIRDEIAAP